LFVIYYYYYYYSEQWRHGRGGKDTVAPSPKLLFITVSHNFLVVRKFASKNTKLLVWAELGKIEILSTDNHCLKFATFYPPPFSLS